MATFTNQATLTYNGNTTNSNVVTGEIVEVLSANKTPVSGTYNSGDTVTYVITARNTGDTPLTGLTLTDDLGAYPFGTGSVTPMTYNPDTVLYYNNGVLQPTPAVTGTDPLTVSNITVPANGNATVVYQATLNPFASPAIGGAVTNTATFSGAGLTADVPAEATINASDEARLNITKAVSPATVSENGTLTYTFVIENFGNTEADAADNVSVSDTFNPILDPIAVSLNGAPLAETTGYTYDRGTGAFTTVPGQITVPPATVTQDPATGQYVVTPGTTTLTVTGTV